MTLRFDIDRGDEQGSDTCMATAHGFTDRECCPCTPMGLTANQWTGEDAEAASQLRFRSAPLDRRQAGRKRAIPAP